MNRFISAALVPCFALCVAYGDDMPHGVITVDAGKVIGAVNPLVFGHNVEAAEGQFVFGPHSNSQGRTGSGLWDKKNKVPVPDAVRFSKEIGMKIMRYPGGCLVHNFDWKRTVGPLDERPDYTFGIDEFMTYCRAVGCEPLMNVAVYVGTPEDKAELVEYLNAPATPDHPWAMKRAQWGHKEPYRVRYFEIGNEEDHGNHDVKPFKKFTVQQYADYYLACESLMKKVDPSIKMGPHLGTGTGPYDKWNAEICRLAGSRSDFLALHTYQVGYHSDTGVISSDKLMRACMAGVDDLNDMLSEYRRIIRENAGRDIPLAITEFNGMFVQNKPIPYRYAYGTALFCADYVRSLLQPEQNILMANYWQFINGYWGFVRGPGDVSTIPEGKAAEWKFLPAYYLFRLWGQHFGTTLLATEVGSPKIDFEGVLRVKPRRIRTNEIIKEPKITLADGSEGNASWKADGTTLTLSLKDYTGERYPTVTTFSVSPSATYQISFKARCIGSTEKYRIGIGLMDGRGWDATKSAIGVEKLNEAADWTDFTGSMTVLPDCTKLILLWRIIGKDTTPVNAAIEVKDIAVVADENEKPPFDALTATASFSANKKTVYVMVFNKHHILDIPSRITVNGANIASGKIWQVTGPLESVNQKGEVAETISAAAVSVTKNTIDGVFPAHSMTAYEFAVR
ncbi:MAG: alpha-L-arabinofuranosidase [Spirochaetota bacterium]